jgi:hypothetical protein
LIAKPVKPPAQASFTLKANRIYRFFRKSLPSLFTYSILKQSYPQGEFRTSMTLASTSSKIKLLAIAILLLPVAAIAADVRIAWDPNSEEDLQGYGVYFSSGVYGPPYSFVGYVELSELANESSPTFLISGLTAGAKYSLAVTAYDADGNESYYSSPVCIEVGAGQIQCASLGGSSSVSSGDSGGGGGGGGGGGCFISAAVGSPVSSSMVPEWIALIPLAGFASLILKTSK